MTAIFSDSHDAHSAGLVRTPAISLHGLDNPYARPDHSRTGFLSCKIKESWPFLEKFRSEIHNTFVSSDLMPALPPQGYAPPARIMSLKYFPTNVANNKITVRGKGFLRSPGFNASEKTSNGLPNFLWRDYAFQNVA